MDASDPNPHVHRTLIELAARRREIIAAYEQGEDRSDEATGALTDALHVLVQEMIKTPTADPRALLAKAEAARSEMLDAHQGNRLDQSELLCLSALDDAIQFFMRATAQTRQG